MKTIFSITLTLFLSLSTFAQDNVDERKMVGFGCYIEGRSTEPVVKVTKLLRTKNYEKISKLLTSRNSGERFLAVISLQRLADNGQYNLSDSEKNLISKAKLSNDLVSVCSGCTYFDKVPMKAILLENNTLGSSYWLDRTINQE